MLLAATMSAFQHVLDGKMYYSFLNSVKKHLLSLRPSACNIILYCDDSIYSVLGRKLYERIFREKSIFIDNNDFSMVRSIKNSGSICLEINDSNILSKNIKIPKNISIINIKKVISFEILKYTPINIDQIYWSFCFAKNKNEPNFYNINIFIIKKSYVDLIIKNISKDILIEKIFFIDSDNIRHYFFRKNNFIKLSLWFFLYFLSFFSIMSCLFFWNAEIIRRVDFNNKEIEKNKIDLDYIQKKELSISVLKKNIDKLDGLYLNRNSYYFLNLLSEKLSDDVYLFSLEMTENELHLMGYSKNTGEMISDLEKNNEFRRIKINTPIVKNSQGLERFDITIAVKEI